MARVHETFEDFLCFIEAVDQMDTLAPGFGEHFGAHEGPHAVALVDEVWPGGDPFFGDLVFDGHILVNFRIDKNDEFAVFAFLDVAQHGKDAKADFGERAQAEGGGKDREEHDGAFAHASVFFFDHPRLPIRDHWVEEGDIHIGKLGFKGCAPQDTIAGATEKDAGERICQGLSFKCFVVSESMCAYLWESKGAQHEKL